MTSTLEQEQGEPAAPATTTVINQHISPVPHRSNPEVEAGWVLKVIPEHKCVTPAIDNQTFVGSIWKCGGCGQNWLVYERRGKNKGDKGLRRIAQDAAQKRRDAAAQGETDPEE